MQPSTRSALLDSISDVATELDPTIEVNSFVLVWDDPLGFVFDVKPEYRAEMAKRMRELADAVERDD